MEDRNNTQPLAEDAARAEEPIEAPAEDFARRDREEFARRFPQVDPEELARDGMFRRFCGSRFGRESLADLYEDFLTICWAAWEASRLRSKDRSVRSTGTGGAGSAEDRLTPQQQQDLREWNKAHPRMQMSAKEYLAR